MQIAISNHNTKGGYTMKKKLTAAVIGSGYMGIQHLGILDKMIDNVILCSIDENTGTELAKKHNCKFYTDYKEMIESEKIDFVSVCLPTPLHHEVTMYALDKGINVLCEKPFAQNPEQAKEMIDKANEKNLLLMVGHLCRFQKHWELLRRCIRDKRYGNLIYLNMCRHSVAPKWSVGGWLENAEKSGGTLKDLHIHDTDLIVHFLGVPESVHTTGTFFASNTVYTYPGNISVTASASWRSNASLYPIDYNFDAIFENGTIKSVNDVVTLYTGDEMIEALDEKEAFPEYFNHATSLTSEIAYFIDCLLNGTKPERCMPEDTLLSMCVNEAEVTSLKSKKQENVVLI